MQKKYLGAYRGTFSEPAQPSEKAADPAFLPMLFRQYLRSCARPVYIWIYYKVAAACDCPHGRCRPSIF